MIDQMPCSHSRISMNSHSIFYSIMIDLYQNNMELPVNFSPAEEHLLSPRMGRSKEYTKV